jgi:hypothetical protein
VTSEGTKGVGRCVDPRPSPHPPGRKLAPDAIPVPAQVVISQGAHQVEDHTANSVFNKHRLHKFCWLSSFAAVFPLYTSTKERNYYWKSAGASARQTNGVTPLPKCRKPKPEGRRKLEGRNPNLLSLEIRAFGFRISFGFRPSSFRTGSCQLSPSAPPRGV